MLKEAQSHLAALTSWVGSLEPAALSGHDARAVLGLATSLASLGADLELLVAPSALAGAPWAEEGYHSPAAWLAEQTRRTVPQAVAVIETAERIEKLPAVAEALSSGRLSSTEARVLASAATAEPAAEAELLEAAAELPISRFCGYARARARDARQGDPDHHRRLHDARYLRFWTDTDGMFHLSGGLLPEDGVQVMSAVRSRAQFCAAEARTAGLEAESQAALDADALVALVTGDERRATFFGTEAGTCRRIATFLHVSADAASRGKLWPGELCEVSGVGPVPLEVLDAVVGDSEITYVADNGVEVSTWHLGRAVSAHTRRTLEARDRTCVVPNCEVSVGLEIDHWQIPFARGGPTELWNLCRLCAMHHRMKTYDGYRLLGGPGKWEWLPPE
jgi:hypothetical protein